MNCTQEDCPRKFVMGFCDACGEEESGHERETVLDTPRVLPAAAYGALSTGSEWLPFTHPVQSAKDRYRSLLAKGAGEQRVKGDLSLWPLPQWPVPSPMECLSNEHELFAASCTCVQCTAVLSADERFCSSCGTVSPFSTLLRPGDVVATQYRVEGLLAKGGMGWLYLAFDLRLDRFVVLKGVINAEDAEAAAGVLMEKRSLSAVNHPGIVAIQSFVVHDGQSYIVMEYVYGTNLAVIRQKSGPMRAHEALGCIMSLLSSVQHLHDAGLAHCDLKPENAIMGDGTLKVIDLGVVGRLGDISHPRFISSGFSPPDSILQKGPSIAWDLYNVGRTLATLLCDFDSKVSYCHTLPPPNALNRMVRTQEVSAALGGDGLMELSFSVGGGPLPHWLSLSRVPNAAGALVYVLHGFAPDGFTSLDVRACPVDAVSEEPALHIRLCCPLADQQLRNLVERATQPDIEGGFVSAAEMSAQCAGVLRGMLGAAGLPLVSWFPFSSPSVPVVEMLDAISCWRALPAPAMVKDDEGFDQVAAALALSLPDARKTALDAVARDSSRVGMGIDAHLRYVDEVLMHPAGGTNAKLDANEQAQVRRFLQLSMEIRPWDWRPTWMEGKYWLSMGEARQAAQCFLATCRALPGESLPQVALAAASEGVTCAADVTGLYDLVLRMNPSSDIARVFMLRVLYANDHARFLTMSSGCISTGLLSEHDLAWHMYRTCKSGDVGIWALSRAFVALQGLPHGGHAHTLAMLSLVDIASSLAVTAGKGEVMTAREWHLARVSLLRQAARTAPTISAAWQYRALSMRLRFLHKDTGASA